MMSATQRNASLGRVLLVDDEEAFLYAAERTLRDAGYDVRAATDYQKALDILAGDEPLDLLVADTQMHKGINGFALARMARMRRLNLKALYATAYEVPTHEAIGKVIRKPVAPEVLLAEVAEAMTTASA